MSELPHVAWERGWVININYCQLQTCVWITLTRNPTRTPNLSMPYSRWWARALSSLQSFRHSKNSLNLLPRTPILPRTRKLEQNTACVSFLKFPELGQADNFTRVGIQNSMLSWRVRCFLIYYGINYVKDRQKWQWWFETYCLTPMLNGCSAIYFILKIKGR